MRTGRAGVRWSILARIAWSDCGAHLQCAQVRIPLSWPHRDGRTIFSCVAHAISRYLVRLDTPPRGAVCRSDRLAFDPDFGQP